MSRLNVFLVDDNPVHNEMLKDQLTEDMDIDISVYEKGTDCLDNMDKNPDVVILDYFLDKDVDTTGLDILRSIKETHPETQVVMLSGQDKLEVAIEMMKEGAYDYVVKGETDFIRTKMALGRIAEMLSLVRVARRGKKLGWIMMGVFILIVIFSIVVYFVFPELLPPPKR